MSFEKHEENEYTKNAKGVFPAALKAVETLEGKLVSQSAHEMKIEAKSPKTILGNTFWEFKLRFGIRKGVTQTAVAWHVTHFEHHLGKAE